jgi:hypothetical protein
VAWQKTDVVPLANIKSSNDQKARASTITTPAHAKQFVVIARYFATFHHRLMSDASSDRARCLSGSGSIEPPDWIEAGDDADALRQAQQLKASARKCEVWQGSRLIGTIEGQRLAG